MAFFVGGGDGASSAWLVTDGLQGTSSPVVVSKGTRLHIPANANGHYISCCPLLAMITSNWNVISFPNEPEMILQCPSTFLAHHAIQL